MSQTIEVTHGLGRLALHHVRHGEGPAALVLHGLGENADSLLTHLVVKGWTGGDVWALDLLGHGASDRSRGGGYTCEHLMADVDAALAHIGPATVFGRGLGAYVALLIAGARPELVRGAVLCDGPGINGGGPSPSTPVVVSIIPDPNRPDDSPDPFVLIELARDVRPPDYAANYCRQATWLSNIDIPITVTAIARPDWLVAVLDTPGVQIASIDDAMKLYGTTSE
jgi:pimeloyl-ACP methyl ester carboxylesterase